MVREVYGVHLSAQQKGRLRKMIRASGNSAQAITLARILLKTDEGWTAPRVCWDCPSPAIPGQAKCEPCTERHRIYRRKSAAAARARLRAERHIVNQS